VFGGYGGSDAGEGYGIGFCERILEKVFRGLQNFKYQVKIIIGQVGGTKIRMFEGGRKWVTAEKCDHGQIIGSYLRRGGSGSQRFDCHRKKAEQGGAAKT